MSNPRLLNLAKAWKSKEAPNTKEDVSDIKDLENILVFAIADGIFVLDNDKSIIQIPSKSRNSIRALCSHDGKLYYAMHCGVFESISDEEVASRTDVIYALCSFKGGLYDAGRYKKILNTFSGEEIAKRNQTIYALCSHEGKLYDGGEGKTIFETITEKKIDFRPQAIRTLCSQKGKLYDGGEYSQVFENIIGQEIISRKEVASRESPISSLCLHNGVLYESGYKRIFDTLSNKKIISAVENIEAICSHPRQYFVDAGVLK